MTTTPTPAAAADLPEAPYFKGPYVTNTMRAGWCVRVAGIEPANPDGGLRTLEIAGGLPTEEAAQQALAEWAAALTASASAEDEDGAAFRAAARLGLTLRFHGGCAQSSMPGAPSAYEVVAGEDRATAMREAVKRAAAVIEAGGEAQRLEQPPQAGAESYPPDGAIVGKLIELARIVDRAVNDWGESHADGSSVVIFHKNEAEARDAILDYLDCLPDNPDPNILESGPIKASRILTATSALRAGHAAPPRAPAAPSAQADAPVPDAWIVYAKGSRRYWTVTLRLDADDIPEIYKGGESVPLYRADAPVPSGWKLVPVEPTKAMLLAGSSDLQFGDCIGTLTRASECYRAMLVAAPQPPASPTSKQAGVPVTLMTEDEASKWAWDRVRQDVGTEGWTTGDSCNFFGFFLHGWRYRGQYELQRPATLLAAAPSAPTQEAAQPAAGQGDTPDPLQGAADWLVQAHAALETSTLAGKLSIGYSRAKRLHDAAMAANAQEGGTHG